ncbi:MAG: hypothetical protein ABSE68_02025 [Minisyncoccia bacterium]
MISSNSLHKSNIVFVFRDKNPNLPENSELTALFQGERGRGAQMVDDPFMRMKILDVPQMKIQVALEGNRLRVEDLEARAPEDSIIIEEGVRIFKDLFLNRQVTFEGFGFNFEIYYQHSDVIRIGDLFNNISSQPLEIGEGLMDFGWQWTTADKNGFKTDGYFLKITAPLEFVIHHNAHFKLREIPEVKEFKKLFESSYQKTHIVAESLKL